MPSLAYLIALPAQGPNYILTSASIKPPTLQQYSSDAHLFISVPHFIISTKDWQLPTSKFLVSMASS